MIFGSTRVDVLRSTNTTDAIGDPVESDDVALAGLPVWIEDGTLNRRDDATGQRLTLSGFWVNVRASTLFVFQPTDRLKDLHTGEVLQIETIRTDSGWGGKRRRIFCTMAA